MLSVYYDGGQLCQVFGYQPTGRTSVIASREQKETGDPAHSIINLQFASRTRYVSLLTGSDKVIGALRINCNKPLSLLQCRNPPTRANSTHTTIPP